MPADTDQPTLAVLKRCPFCGAHDEFNPSVSQSHKYAEPGDVGTGKVANLAAGLVPAGWYVECDECGACGGHDDDRNKAVDAWNTRTNSEPRPAGDLREADAEVQRILAMSDDQIMAEADVSDMAWARGFKQGLNTGRLTTHSPAPMADPMKVGLAIQSAWGEDDMGFDNTLPPIEFSDAELRHLGAAAIRAVAHPSTQEGSDRG